MNLQQKENRNEKTFKGMKCICVLDKTNTSNVWV